MMAMNMFLHELKTNRKSTIIWTCSLVAVAVLFIALFSSVQNDIAGFKKYLENMPQYMKAAFDISVNYINTLEGFYSFAFTFVVLLGAIQTMNLGASIISKEVHDKTADFLLTKPVSRRAIMTAKLMAALTSIVITNAVYLIITCFAASIIKTNVSHMNKFFLISITLFFVQLIFLSLGVIVSVIVPKIKSVISVSLSIVFGFYIIGMLGSVVGEKAIRYISPLKYFDTTYIIKNTGYETSFTVLGAVIIIASIIASYLIYMKKDIHAV